MTRSSRPRNISIDTAKVICLYIICFSHIPPATGSLHNFITSFHVQIFFLFSGAFFVSKDLKATVRRGLDTLLIPALIFNVIVAIAADIVAVVSTRHFDFNAMVINPLAGTLLGTTDIAAPYRLPAGPSWFLIALFVARIFMNMLMRSNNIRRIVMCLALTAIIIVTEHYHMWTPWSLQGAILGLPFMIIGYWTRKYIIQAADYKIYLRVAAIALLIPSLYFLANINGVVTTFNGTFGSNFVLFIAAGTLGSVMLLLICSMIQLPGAFLRLMIDGSVMFICLHMFVMEYVMLIYRRVTTAPEHFSIADKLVITVGVVAIMTLIMLAAKKFYPRLLK